MRGSLKEGKLFSGNVKLGSRGAVLFGLEKGYRLVLSTYGEGCISVKVLVRPLRGIKWGNPLRRRVARRGKEPHVPARTRLHARARRWHHARDVHARGRASGFRGQIRFEGELWRGSVRALRGAELGTRPDAGLSRRASCSVRRSSSKFVEVGSPLHVRCLAPGMHGAWLTHARGDPPSPTPTPACARPRRSFGPHPALTKFLTYNRFPPFLPLHI